MRTIDSKWLVGLAAGWLATVATGLWMLQQFFGRDLVTLLGVVFIWLVSIAVAAGYLLVFVQPPPDGPMRATAISEQVTLFYWVILFAFIAVPGVWIGLTATNPLLVATAALVLMEGLRLANRFVNRRLSLQPLTVRQQLELFRDRGVLLLAATLLGIGVRHLIAQ